MAVDKPNTEVQPDPVDDLLAPEVSIEESDLEEEVQSPAPKVHPLVPGGKRFEQIYAQGKEAARERDRERELRIAAEAKLEALTSTKLKPESTNEVEYTWQQLEEFIAQGRITRADAEAHREEVIERRVLKKAQSNLAQETQRTTRVGALDTHINAYVNVVPAILQEDSADRQRLDEEFDFVASVQGVDSTKITEPERKALQLIALRNVYGPIDSLTKRTATPKRETLRETSGGTPPRSGKNPDQALLDSLSKPQVAHYQKMIAAGRYPNKWKDVVEELKFQKPQRTSR